MDTNNFGETIKRQRISKGLSLTQLSLESGVSPTHLSRIELGKRFPSGRTLRKLAEPLGFSEIELLKLAGFLSRDDSDHQIERLKREIKRGIARALLSIYEKVDSF